MNVFAVFHEQPREDPFEEDVLGQFGEDALVLSDRLLLVRSHDEVPDNIAERMGFARGESEAEAAPRIGVVLKLNASHEGYYYSHLWDWLRQARELA